MPCSHYLPPSMATPGRGPDLTISDIDDRSAGERLDSPPLAAECARVTGLESEPRPAAEDYSETDRLLRDVAKATYPRAGLEHLDITAPPRDLKIANKDCDH